MKSHRIIKNGTYIFEKSGSEVRVLEKSEVKVNGKTVKGHTVERVDTKKTMFVPIGSLLEKEK